MENRLETQSRRWSRTSELLRNVLPFLLLFSTSMVFAADAIQVSPERLVATSFSKVDDIDYAWNGTIGLLFWRTGGQQFVTPLDADGAQLGAGSISLPAESVRKPRLVSIDHDGFIVVAQSEGGVSASWISNEGAFEVSRVFAPGATGFALAKTPAGVLVAAGFEGRPSGENLRIYRLTTGRDIIPLSSLSNPPVTSMIAGSFNGGRCLLDWTEENAYTACDRGAFGWYCWTETVIRQRSGVMDLARGVVVGYGEGLGPNVFARGDRFGAFARTYFLDIRDDGSIEKKVEIVPPVFIDSFAPMGSQVLIAEAPRTESLASDVTGRWVDLDQNPIVASDAFELANQTSLYAIRDAGDGRLAIVYTKIASSSPDQIFIRFAGNQLARRRAVRR